jgi:hypothetical protein
MSCLRTLCRGKGIRQSGGYEDARREHGISEGLEARAQARVRYFKAGRDHSEIATRRGTAGGESGASVKGEWKGYWDCHVEPDWLLIYKVTDDEVRLARTGTHADLFEG